MYEPIQKAIENAAVDLKFLLGAGLTTNNSERFMSLMAKYTIGKQTFEGARDSYYLIAHVPVIKYNTGCVYTTLSKYSDVDWEVAYEVEAKHALRKIES